MDSEENVRNMYCGKSRVSKGRCSISMSVVCKELGKSSGKIMRGRIYDRCMELGCERRQRESILM